MQCQTHCTGDQLGQLQPLAGEEMGQHRHRPWHNTSCWCKVCVPQVVSKDDSHWWLVKKWDSINTEPDVKPVVDAMSLFLCSTGDQQGRLQLVAGEKMGQYRHRPCWADPFTGTSGVEDHLCCHRASQARTRWFVWFLSLWCLFFHVNLEWQLHCSCGNLVVSTFISLTVVWCGCKMFLPDMT